MNAHRRPLRWLRKNLFATPGDSLLTLLILPALIWAAYCLLDWGIGVARWHAVEDNLRVLMVGTFPAELAPRAWAAAALMSALVGITLGGLVVASAGFTMASILVLAAAALYASGSGQGAMAHLCGCLAAGIAGHALSLKAPLLRRTRGCCGAPDASRSRRSSRRPAGTASAA